MSMELSISVMVWDVCHSIRVDPIFYSVEGPWQKNGGSAAASCRYRGATAKEVYTSFLVRGRHIPRFCRSVPKSRNNFFAGFCNMKQNIR